MHGVTTLLVGDQLVDLEVASFDAAPGWALFTRTIGAPRWTVSCLCPQCRSRAATCAVPQARYESCAAAMLEPTRPRLIRPR